MFLRISYTIPASLIIIIDSIFQFYDFKCFFSSRPMADEFRIIDINKLPKSKSILARFNKIKANLNSPMSQLIINEITLVTCLN
jgi:hypothetical protein